MELDINTIEVKRTAEVGGCQEEFFNKIFANECFSPEIRKKWTSVKKKEVKFHLDRDLQN